MALFKKTKKDKEAKAETKKDSVKKTDKTVAKSTVKSATKNLSAVFKKPRITEKAAIISGTNNVYTFDVDQRSTKTDILAAIEMIYKVKPLKIRTSLMKKKVVKSRKGKTGYKGGGKKAYVYLKKGDKIEFV